jgi:DNA-binding Lrp family transcriptional regulator
MIDEKDQKILTELKKNARQSTKNIANKLKIPRVTVHDRIQKMVDNGIIELFTVKPDYKKIDLPTKVFVFLAITPNNVTHRDLASKISKLPGVYEVHMITGEYDLLVKVRGKNIEEIGRIVIDKLRVMEGVGKSFTSACFETIEEKI